MGVAVECSLESGPPHLHEILRPLENFHIDYILHNIYTQEQSQLNTSLSHTHFTILLSKCLADWRAHIRYT